MEIFGNKFYMSQNLNITCIYFKQPPNTKVSYDLHFIINFIFLYFFWIISKTALVMILLAVYHFWVNFLN